MTTSRSPQLSKVFDKPQAQSNRRSMMVCEPRLLMISRSASRSARRGSTLALVIITLIAVVLIVSLAYFLRPGPDVEKYLARQGEYMESATGLSRQISNKLSDKFTDADADLVADAPTDVAKHIDPEVLKFTYLATSNPEETKKAFEPWVKSLAQATGKQVEYVPFSSPDEQLVALRDGVIHVMAFNTGGVPIAVDAGGFVPVAVLGDSAGQSKAQVKIIAAASTDTAGNIKAALKDKELTLTEPTSNSGFKAPLVLLNDQNMKLGRDYSARYSGGHSESIAGIASGKYTFAAVASDVLSRDQAAGRIKAEQYKVIFESEKFPTASFGHVHNLKPELAEKVRKGLLEFKWEGTSVAEFFDGTGQTRLVAVNYKDDFSLVRRIDNAIGFEHIIKDIPPDLSASGEKVLDTTTMPTTKPE